METVAKQFEPDDQNVPAVAGRIGPDAETRSPAVERGQSPTDRELIVRVLDGDRPAFDVLIARYQRQAVAVSYRLLGNGHDALDVTQDAFYKAFNSLATLQNPDAFGGWLMRIVSNLSLNYRRGRKTRTKAQLPLDDMLGGEGGGASASDWSAKTADPARTLASREM